MDNFANIGKAVLLQSTGLQKNHTEVIEDTVEVTDYNNAACKDCKYRALKTGFPASSEIYKAAEAVCDKCPNRVLTTETVYKKIYHNEKNKYGYKPRLKSNAIKLLILLHFYAPDRFGIIKNVNTDELSAYLNCDIKTIKNNLETLTDYGYISYHKTSPHYISLCLNDYEKYYLPANQGGRGFFVMSKELLMQLLSIDNLMSLRIHIRELIDIDNLNIKGPFTAVSKTYNDIRLGLPDYCKPCNIRAAVKDSRNIFDISFKENSIRFEIRDIFNSRKQKEECYNSYIEMFNVFLHSFNEAVISMNTSGFAPDEYAEFFNASPDGCELTEAVENTFSHYHLIKIRDFEFEDLAQLALQYSYEAVIAAYAEIYKSYILKDRRITNLGGLVRTVITANLKSISSQAA